MGPNGFGCVPEMTRAATAPVQVHRLTEPKDGTREPVQLMPKPLFSEGAMTLRIQQGGVQTTVYAIEVVLGPVD